MNRQITTVQSPASLTARGRSDVSSTSPPSRIGRLLSRPRWETAVASRSCQGCDLYKAATRTVFGDGDPDARAVVPGEQPGDRRTARDSRSSAPLAGFRRGRSPTRDRGDDVHLDAVAQRGPQAVLVP
ncbi:uracil-DNA glycosylase family 4 [Thermasporomyces composti]|jgi:hypothetical protein|uniref:Uracil-DNA glycosylase family 4 n=1 Tax=Thermasporomyces composti TaxID=696763 RepID=A0A3D9V3U1_THECX|nr:uracil-DNA glycosylase family 4 [Thermasporomyces composti]